MTKPEVLFVCKSNSGKSQMAAGLMRQLAGEGIEVHSAGTAPGTAINAQSAESLLEVGVVEGMERMRLIRDDITDRVKTLAAQLLGSDNH